MSDSPVVLTREQAENKVPVTVSSTQYWTIRIVQMLFCAYLVSVCLQRYVVIAASRACLACARSTLQILYLTVVRSTLTITTKCHHAKNVRNFMLWLL